MKRSIHIAGLLFALALCLTLLPGTARAATVASGDCGDNLTWTLDDKGTLTISGTGAMRNYDWNGSPWFSRSSSVKTVVIGSGVTGIGDCAFYFCEALTSVTIPNSVTSIGEYAFFECSALMSVTIPNSVTSIGNRAFYYCYALTSVTIPNSVTSIGNEAFYDCDALTSVTIGSGVTSIGNYAFYDCYSLKYVYYKGSASQWEQISIGNSNNSLTNATHIYLNGECGAQGGNLTWTLSDAGKLTISGTGEMADYSDDDTPWYKPVIKTVVIGKDVTSIGDEAFTYCDALTSVTIGSGVTSVENGAFAGCDALASIKVETGSSYLAMKDGVLYNKAKTKLICCPAATTNTSLSIPTTVTAIEAYAFYGCTALASVTIPNSVTSIENEAFRGSGLTSVEIPDSITGIQTLVFADCAKLASVTVPNSVTSIGGGCVFQLHEAQERHDTRQRDEHRKLCVQRLHRAHERKDTRFCFEHRGIYVLRLHKAEKRQAQGQCGSLLL